VAEKMLDGFSQEGIPMPPRGLPVEFIRRKSRRESDLFHD
jgi:hypothetical protein